MAAVATLLTHGSDGWETANDTGFTTASISPGADCVLVLLMGGVNDDAGGGNNLFDTSGAATSSGSGPTWTRRAGTATTGAFVSLSGIWTATIAGSDPGSFTVSYDWGTGNRKAGSWAYALYKVTGHDTSTPLGGLVSTVAQNGNGAETATLSAAPAAGDITLALNYADTDDSGGGATFGSSFGTWTENADGAGSGHQAIYNAGQRTGSIPIASSVLSPAATSVAVDLPAVTASASDSAEPAATSVGVTLPAPTLAAGAAPTPDTTVVAVDLPAVTASGGTPAVVSPDPISVAVTLPAPALIGGATVAPAPIAIVFLLAQVLAEEPVLEYIAGRSVHPVLSGTVAHLVTLSSPLVKVQVINLDATEPLYVFISGRGEAPTVATVAADDSFTVPPGRVVANVRRRVCRLDRRRRQRLFSCRLLKRR
jgi:hypothetical protein